MNIRLQPSLMYHPHAIAPRFGQSRPWPDPRISIKDIGSTWIPEWPSGTAEEKKAEIMSRNIPPEKKALLVAQVDAYEAKRLGKVPPEQLRMFEEDGSVCEAAKKSK